MHVGIVAKLRELQIAEDGADLWTIAAIYAKYSPEHIAANVAHVLKTSRFVNAGRVIAGIRENWAHFNAAAQGARVAATARAGGAAVDAPPATPPPFDRSRVDAELDRVNAATPAQLRDVLAAAARVMRPSTLRARVAAALADPSTDPDALRALARTNAVRCHFPPLESH